MANTFGGYSALKPNFFNMDIIDSEPPQTGTIFHNKRNTQQVAPNYVTKVREVNRNLVNTSDPLRMNSYTRRALQKTGCQKEQ